MLFLAVHVTYVFVTGLDMQYEIRRTSGILFYIENWNFLAHLGAAFRHPTINGSLGHMWSLSIEEQFYLAWPLVLLLTVLAGRRQLRVAVALLALAIVAVVLWRTYLFDTRGFLTAYVRTDTRADGLLLGALAAFAWVHRRTPRSHLLFVAVACAAALLVAVVVVDPTTALLYQGGLTVVAIAAVGLVLAIVDDERVGRLFALRPLVAVGRVSYGIYLWHPFVFVAVDRLLASGPLVLRLVLDVTVTTVCTWLSWRLVETPALRLKNRRVLGPNPARGPAPAVSS